MAYYLTLHTVYVIAGPNGAGKTTFATTFLPDLVQCAEFLNADLIAARLAPLAPESRNLQAGRLMLARMNALAEARETFGFETTLAGHAQLRFVEKLGQAGYRIVFVYLWLRNVEHAIRRVASRVLQGGHHVSEETIRRRYAASLRNVPHFQEIAHHWGIYDGHSLPPRPIAEYNQGVESVYADEEYQEFRRSCGSA